MSRAAFHPPTKPPWPSDAVMIVCAEPAAARREQMDSVHPARCRDCGCELVCDGYTVTRALAMPERRGRPIDFFCLRCAVRHDRSSIDVLEDHRQHKQGVEIQIRRL